MIYTVTLNPALDKTAEIASFTPNKVNRITTMRQDPGGKGINVSKVIKQLGGKSIACGIFGGRTGETILSAVHESGIETFFVNINGETRTNLKITDPVNHTNTDINEQGPVVPAEALESLLGVILKKVTGGDIVVISGSLPKGAPADTYSKWIRMLNDKGAKVFLDTGGDVLRGSVASAPYLIKPNHLEFAELCGKEVSGEVEIKAAAKAIMSEYGISRVVVSMGAEGAVYVSRENCYRTKGLKVPVGSTVGAGDSVVAALAYAMEKGMGFKEAARLSTATGAANVMCSGSQAAEYKVVLSLLPKVEIESI